jgi:importin-9
LIHNQRDTILGLLESSNVDGDSGLNVFVQTLCENMETFQGFWPSRVSTLALISLFASERPSLKSLIVKGDIVVKADGKNGE